MGAFKNEKNGTWYVQFRYTDWQGLRQQKLKRGFATKREAQEWERAFLTEKKADVTMPFKTFTELYEKDVRPKLKENTWLTKEHIIKTKILPYFEHKRLCDISAKDVARYFKAVDSYHRLNITNGNLYRENEMLSKINSKLKNENENLRSEVKDYKLLRKVFGSKQIDELLEQARNIKGRKRENPRSR